MVKRSLILLFNKLVLGTISFAGLAVLLLTGKVISDFASIFDLETLCSDLRFGGKRTKI